MANRKDSKGYALRTGEVQRKDGRYSYSWKDRTGERHYIYAKELAALRQKEAALRREYDMGLDPMKAKSVSVNDMVEKYLDQKHNLKTTTKGTYKYIFEHFISETFGKNKIVDVKYSDVKKFYYSLIIDRGIKGTTVDHVHCVLHPSFQMAVRDGLIRTNPSDEVMNEIKRSKFWVKTKRKALTVDEQRVFLKHLKETREYVGWLPIITVLIGTGMRIGECLGITWSDLDFENRIIHVNHELSDNPDENGKCKKRILPVKTEAGVRTIPMIQEVYDAFLDEYEFQKCIGFCEEEIDGYSGFVFSTSSYTVYLPGAVNNAIHRATNDYNEKEKVRALIEGRDPFFLPSFSAHNLRHTFCTRFCENESNVKIIQSVMGHAEISTTLNIYADATEDKKKEIMANMEGKIII